jgi:hypothetical protein
MAELQNNKIIFFRELIQRRVKIKQTPLYTLYRMFHCFRQAKFAKGGLILKSTQFLLLSSKVAKTNSKIIISLT